MQNLKLKEKLKVKRWENTGRFHITRKVLFLQPMT